MTNHGHEHPAVRRGFVTVDPHDLIGPYAVGALDVTEATLFKQHLEACARCRVALPELRAAAVRLVDPGTVT